MVHNEEMEEEHEEMEEENNKEMEKIGLAPFLGLVVGSMLVGTSVGCCQAR